MMKNEPPKRPLSENPTVRRPTLQIKSVQPTIQPKQEATKQEQQRQEPVKKSTIEFKGMQNVNRRLEHINQEMTSIKEKIDTISLPSAGLLAGERIFMQYRYDNGTIYLGE